MMIEMQFNSIAQLQRLQEIASSCDDEIFLHSLDDSVRVDAKSFIGLFTPCTHSARQGGHRFRLFGPQGGASQA